MKKSTKTVTVDNRKRELRKGEDQQPDGRYRYRYKDLDGTMRSVYSWRLVDADTPQKGEVSVSRSELSRGRSPKH